MLDLSDFLPAGTTYAVSGASEIDVLTRDGFGKLGVRYTLDVECRTVTIHPVDRCFSLRELADLLSQATSFEHGLDEEAWKCAEQFLGWEP